MVVVVGMSQFEDSMPYLETSDGIGVTSHGDFAGNAGPALLG